MVWQEVSRRTKKEKSEISDISEYRLSFEGGRRCVGERILPREGTASLVKRLGGLREKFPALDIVLEEKRYIGSGGKPFDCHLLTATGTDVDQVKFCLNLAIDRNFRGNGLFTEIMPLVEETRKFVENFLSEVEALTATKLRLVKSGLEISADVQDAVEDARLCISARLDYFDKFVSQPKLVTKKSLDTIETCSSSSPI